MTARFARPIHAVLLLVLLATCVAPSAIDHAAADPATTSGAIAIANLDHLIAQRPSDDVATVDLLLARSRFLADYDALDRAAQLAEPRAATAADLTLRARTRAAAHRFTEALTDLDQLDHLPDIARATVRPHAAVAQRAAILVAIGRAGEALPTLEADVADARSFASLGALATGYAALGRFRDADRLYTEALAALDTTSPFPYAWIYLARGKLWADHGRDPALAAQMFTRALAYLPEFAAARIEIAELEAARGDVAAAIAHLEPVAARDEPEALAHLSTLLLDAGDPRGQAMLARAHLRFATLLARNPLAFADHAAEFYLGPGADPAHARDLALQNFAARPTARAVELVLATTLRSLMAR